MEAKANDAPVIHIDPRFTRTSALSDLHVPLRAGTDIALLGGVINYILSNELDFREYVLAYTNAERRPAGCWTGSRDQQQSRRRSSRPASPPTPRCCCPRPPRRPGTRRTPSCRSSSPARPRRARVGLAMVLTPVDEAGPARMFAWYGGVSELVASKLMEQRLGLASEAYTTGRAHQLRTWSQRLTAAGLLGATLAGRRSRVAAMARALPYWWAARCRGSASSKRASRRPRTQSMWSSHSASASKG
jgi:anaerobic selenocysteine-containing dehydrogenase